MKILFFTPHAALWVHTVPEAYLARALASEGFEVEYLSCERAQNYCACMTSRRLEPGCTPEQSAAICDFCELSSKSLQRSYRLPSASLAQYLRPEDTAECKTIAESAVADRSLDTEYLGVKVGRIALYEFTLFHKKMSTNLTDDQWHEYGTYVENALITLIAFSRHISVSRPDVVTTFSPQYSNLNSCMQYALTQGIRTLFMESGTNLSHRLGTMRVWDWGVHRLVNPALRYWGESAHNPVTSASAGAVVDHFRQLLSGQHFAVFSSAYSGTHSIRELWGIQPQQKIALMTLSSYDEAYAALLIDGFPEEKVFSSVFRTQAQWIAATIEWAKSQPDIFFVVRVHPRDFPNKRESLRSEQSFALEALLQNVPKNVHVNWPSEGLSLYALLEDTDAVLTGWSVTAMEALILGIPVVTYDRKLPSYPSDVMWTGSSETEYRDNVLGALSAGWNISNVRNGFRWLAYNFVESTVTVSRSFGNHELADRPRAQRLWRRFKDGLPVIGQPLDLLGWTGARAGAKVVAAMLTAGYDAIAPAKAALRIKEPLADDSEVIDAALSELYGLLYADSTLPEVKPGLAKNIREHLARARST